MRVAHIHEYEITHPEGGKILKFEIIELIGGRPHRSFESWETHSSYDAAVAEAERRSFTIVDWTS